MLRRLIFLPPPPEAAAQAPLAGSPTITTATGRALVLGADTAPATMVFLHGNAEDARELIGLIPFLRAGFRVVIPEYPGYGIAADLPRPTERSVYTAVEEILNHMAPVTGPLVIVGHSLGSAVATEMAVRGHGTHLVLTAPFTSVNGIARTVFRFTPAWISRDRFDTLGKAHRVTQPALLIRGAQDEMLPQSMTDAVAQRIPNSQTASVAGRGHNDLWSPPSPVTELITRFVFG
ncbi:alpha/beta fold hydrolase [Williamsia sp. CHRR-6]|uniref:alpha/beta fold hydrolase n=1 Tax=Williamsia sp. CHRR-6 TaxID=2835871 RepID=UPI001BDB66B2|nr:alpha/beta fold hydrolase [Williamsia sp. CHRR-6]MBT0566883.1 alpha/beta fold hydrolase [Williamsia sp. CHRR-6]